MSVTFHTYLLQEAHILILRDWWEFLSPAPTTLSLYVGEDPAIRAAAEAFADEVGVTLRILDTVGLKRVATGETELLSAQFEASEDEWNVVVRLDTYCYRDGNDGWFGDLLTMMEQDEYLYFTSSTRAYRDDVALPGTPYLKTQRESNNCAVFRRDEWLKIQRDYAEWRDPSNKFYVEAAVERHAHKTGRFGLRRQQGRDWRVFHTQVWDGRMAQVRDDFRAGVDIASFAKTFEDGLRYKWERYYQWPKPPWHERARIRFGAWRREVLMGQKRPDPHGFLRE